MLVEQFPEIANTQPEVLARSWGERGRLQSVPTLQPEGVPQADAGEAADEHEGCGDVVPARARPRAGAHCREPAL